MKNVVKFIVRIILSIIYRLHIVNRENIPAKGAAIFCANHVGELDMFFMGCTIKRLVHYMAKEELFRNPIVAAFIKWFGAFPVKRGKADIESIKTAIKLLEEGHILGIFPEGTRTRGKSNKNIKVKPGAAMFAVKTGAPIIPVAIEGSYKPFSRIKVVYGKPFYLDIDKEKKYTNDELTEMSRDIMNKVYALLEGN